MPLNLPVLKPNFGLYFDRPPNAIPQRALQDGLNFRIKGGKISNLNLGWERFSTAWQLNGPVSFIDNFFPRDIDEQLLFGTLTDIYRYVAISDTVVYLTPRYETGTVAVSGTGVTGTGTLWLANAKAGDQITFGNSAITETGPAGNDSFTKVLLHMNGADASTVFNDNNSGGSAHTWTAVANAQVDTAQNKFGGASALFDGTGDLLSTPDSADYALGTSDFTIDFWVRMGAGTDGVSVNLAGQTDIGITAAASSFMIERQAGHTIRLRVFDGAAATLISTTSTVTAANGWHHIEFSRSGSNLLAFFDGALEATVAFTGTVPNSTETLAVGDRRGTASATPHNGWIDEFRLSVGTARHTAAFTPPTQQFATTWFTILQVNTDTSITLTASAGTIAATSFYTIRKLFTGNIADIWSFDTFIGDAVSGNDLWLATNGLEPVVSWDGAATQVTLQSGLGFTCKVLGTFSNMMIYANITQAGDYLPSSIINSDVSKPLDTVSGLASQFRVHDGSDEIMNLVPLSDNLIIYAERHIVQAQFVGDPLVFVFREPISGLGPTSHNGIADFGDFHEFLASDAQYSFDGVAVRETNSQVWREVIRQSDPMRRRRLYAHFDEENGDLIWSVPGTTDPGSGNETAAPTIAWSEHYLEDIDENTDQPHSKRQFPFTAAGYYEQVVGLTWDTIPGTWDAASFPWNDQALAAGFPLNLAGDDNGFIWTINTIQTADGALLPFRVRFGRLFMETGRERSLLTRVYPFTEQTSQNLNVTVLMTDHAAASAVNVGTFPFSTALLEGVFFVTVYRRGRYVEIEFSNDGTPVVIWGYDLDWVQKGGLR